MTTLQPGASSSSAIDPRDNGPGEERIHALFISFLFPPGGGGGVQRTVKFIKYLSRLNTSVTVLCGSPRRAARDHSLFEDVPRDVEILRVPGLFIPDVVPWIARDFFTRWVLTVDKELGWLPFAAAKGSAILGGNRPVDIIYSTSSPYTDHLVAWHLKRKFGLPWVADFRDPWTDNFSATFATSFHKRFCARLERGVIESADKILVVSNQMRTGFLRRYPNVDQDRIAVIPNGFDHEDYPEQVVAPRDNTKFSLTYTGSLYGRRQSARPFLTAMKSVLDSGRIPRSGIELHFVGSVGAGTREIVDRLGLSDVVEITDYVPHSEITETQLAADALLLIIGSGPGSEVVFTGKIFEYLAARRPILAVVPEGAAADLIRTTKSGTVVSPDHKCLLEDALVSIYSKWKEGTLEVEGSEEVIRPYRRSEQAHTLRAIFEELLCGG